MPQQVNIQSPASTFWFVKLSLTSPWCFQTDLRCRPLLLLLLLLLPLRYSSIAVAVAAGAGADAADALLIKISFRLGLLRVQWCDEG